MISNFRNPTIATSVCIKIHGASLPRADKFASTWLETCGICISRYEQQYTTTTNTHLVHLADELVDVSFPVAEVTTLHVVLELACPPATSGVRQLERPQEVRRLLEVGAGGDDFVHKILYAENVVLAESLLDDLVVGQGDALFVDLAVTTLVDKLTDRLQVGLAVQCHHPAQR